MVSMNNMYPDTLNFQIEEPFPFEYFDSDLIPQHQWDWELEKVNNGDVAVIPSYSEVASMQYASNSPPAAVDYYKLNSDWQNLMSMDMLDIENTPILEQEEKLVNMIPDLLTENDKLPTAAPVPNQSVSAGKRIDMNAQCYIINDQRVSPKVELADSESDSDNDESDTTVTNNSSSDMQSSGIQSESNEENEVINQPVKTESNGQTIQNNNHCEDNLDRELIDVISVSSNDLVLLAGDVDSLLEQFEATPELSANIEQTKQNEHSEISPRSNCDDSRKTSSFYAEQFQQQNSQFKNNLKPQSQVSVNSKSNLHKKSNHQQSNVSTKSKEILDSLPLELVKKIQSNNKRKLVPVIDPVPNKRRAVVKKQPEVNTTVTSQIQINSVKLDHSYCLQQWKKEEVSAKTVPPASYPKCPNKDSGFQSAEEDNMQTHLTMPYINERTVLKSNIIKRQINSVNMKQGVSVLKPKVNGNNTINYVDSLPSTSSGPSSFNGTPVQSVNPVKESPKKKKKLNLAEYKKRRDLPRSSGSSQNASPGDSGPCSPDTTKDEQESYQQRLMQMAAEVLRATPKSAVSAPSPSTAQPKKVVAPTAAASPKSVAAPPAMPPHLERKEFVSIGVNTDGAGLSLKHLNVPLKELEEIRPILENASDKISNSSLIASVIENVQNKKIKHKVEHNDLDKRLQEYHGEDKVIMWPEKNRPKKPTKDAYVQTEAVVEPETSGHRRTQNSKSSSIENIRRRKRSTSRDSRYSYTSHSSPSSSLSSPSYSPSPLPRYKRRFNERDVNEKDEDYVHAVYERRIVYVGGIDSSITTECLRRRFQRFGQIIDVKLHFPTHRDNYGFLTFANREDAYRALEHGNDNPSLPRYDLNFGGRRIFCEHAYADLDNVREDMIYASPVQDTPVQELSFDNLLEETQAIITRKRKCT